MPLRDHFSPPVSEYLPWPSLYSGWTCHIADHLIRAVPDGVDRYYVETAVHPAVKSGVDVVSASDVEAGSEWRSVWQPPAPTATTRITFAEQWEVQAYRDSGGKMLVAVVSLVAPNESTEIFAQKVWAMLRDGVCVLVIDLVSGEALDAVRLAAGHGPAATSDARRLGAGTFDP